MRRTALAFVSVLILSATTTSKAIEPREFGETRARMYLTALHGGLAHLQVRLCRHPGDETGCHRMANGVRDGIAAGFEGAIRFVHRRWPNSDAKYWVLSPIAFGDRFARFRYRWETSDGCVGRGALRFERRQGGGWQEVGGTESVGCPA